MTPFPRFSQQRPAQQSGLTLVEIMVALTISSLLIAGVVQIFISNKATYRMQEGLSRMQENARFALDFITRDVRQAGYLGCTRNLDNLNIMVDSPAAYFQPEFGIEGWEYTGTGPNQSIDLNAVDETPADFDSSWQTASGSSLSGGNIDLLSGSDVLRVWHVDAAPPLRVTNISGPGTDFIGVNSSAGIASGNFILLSDCVTSDLMQVCDVENTGLTIQGSGCGNDSAKQLSVLDVNAEVSRLTASTYFIKKHENNPQNPPSLFFSQLGSDGESATGAQELIQGVESMQILYGEESTGGNLRYLTANNVSDWRAVSTVKIGLLMSTVTEVDTLPSTTSYNVNGTTMNIAAPDRRPRKVYSTTIHLRNRST